MLKTILVPVDGSEAAKLALEMACKIARADQARVILDEAQRTQPDMIVMGSRGLSDIRGLVVGSVSHKVSHAAPCHVVTVH